MDQEPETPEKPVIPPPNLPKPPPPDLPKPPPPVETPPAPAAAKVKIRATGDAGEDEPAHDGLAPLNSRILAALVDAVVAIGLQLALLWILPSFAGKIAWLAGLAYLVTRDSLPFLGGQSVGKKALKLRAVTLDGAPLTGKWEPGIVRNAVLIIPFFPFIELFVLLNREEKPERGLRLGDEWAKTKVIVAETPAAESGDAT